MDNIGKYNLISVKFAQAEQPKFEERRGQGYIQYGANNDYPDYLLKLYKESSKHGAIIKGKSNYIYGKGFNFPKDLMANTQGENWNNIFKKAVKDDEIFCGYYLQIIYNLEGKIKDVYHLDFKKVRINKEQNCFYVKNDWQDNREKARAYPAFTGTYNKDNPSQVLFVKQYNPGDEIYPTPNYYQALNYIESDVQVSRHILGNAKDGFVATTAINLNNGEPNEEQKEQVEKDIKKKFTGSEGDRVLLFFNKSKDTAAEVIPLSQTMLTKEDFTNINNLIQQEIFAGHQITSPMLFGIKTEGQLGGSSEIRDAYEIFNNTYVAERQQQHTEVFNKLLTLMGDASGYVIVPVEPLGFTFSENIQSQNLTKDEIREVMGYEPLDPSIKSQAQIISDNINSLSPLVANKVLESMTPDEIRSLAGLIPAAIAGQQIVGDGSMPTPPPVQLGNDNIKNLTGRQYQNVMRIVRQFNTGKLTKEQAALMLKQGFSFTDEDVNVFLGVIDEQQFSDQDIIDFALLEQFAQYGEDKNNFEELSRKDAIQSEYFANVQELSQLESNILNLIKKDKRITTEVLASTLKVEKAVIAKALTSMEDGGIFTVSNVKQGEDIIVERTATNIKIEAPKPTTTEILLRYSYDGPQDDKNRPFCAKLMELNRLYSRSDIETISERLGYSVWDRRGGWFTQPDGTHRPFCRHKWFALTVVRKNN